MLFSRTKIQLFVAALALAGCGDESPPFEALPLRDALRLSPEVMASLPRDSRHELATRFEQAERAEEEPFSLAAPEVPTLDNLVDAADMAREAAGKDSVVLGELSLGQEETRLLPFTVAEGDQKKEDPPELSGKPNAATEVFEALAIKGRAGQVLNDFGERAQTKRFVRATGLAIGAVAWKDTVYVNASWLIAMEALEDGNVQAPVIIPSPASPGKLETPRPEPVSVDLNPYDLPKNLTECETQVLNTCQCGVTQTCAHDVTDSTFTDANAECAWVNQAPANASGLCILALLDIDNVRECVEKARTGCPVLPVLTKEDAVLFAANATCVAALDACLNNGVPLGESDTCSSCNTCGDCDHCKYCDDKGNDCQECADDCGTAAQLCEACAKICDAATNSPQAGASVSASNQCSMRPRPGKSPLPSPMGTVLWLFAPIAYLLSRTRRRP